MPTPNLLKIYRQNESESRALYEQLYQSPLTHKIGIELRHLNASRSFPCFYYYTEEIMQVTSAIMTELRTLTAITSALPLVAIESFRRVCLIEEIQSTNAIEGVRSTRKEINRAIDEQSDANAAKNVRLWSTVNKYLKLQQQEEIPFRTSTDLRTFYDEFLADEIRRDNPKHLPDGKVFRTDSVDVWGKTKVIHRGILPEEKIIQYMDTALDVLQSDQIPGLIRISLFHYLFGYIHPFYDGNGRTARFITSYYLARFLHPLVAMRLSITIRKSLRVYYKLFEDTNHPGNYGDLTPFITGFLWLIQKSITRVHELLMEKDRQLDMLSENLKKAANISSTSDWKIYFVLLQVHLFSDEGSTLEDIARTVGQSTRTVRNHISSYPSEHITINRSHRAHRFKLSRTFIEKLQSSISN